MKRHNEARLSSWSAIGAIGLFVGACFMDLVPLFQDVREFLSMVNDVAATLIGFIVATLIYLLGISDGPGMRFVKQAGKYPVLIDYFVSAGLSWMILCVLNLIIVGAMSASFWLHGYCRLALIGGWFSLAVYAVVSLFRLMIIIKSIAVLISGD